MELRDVESFNALLRENGYATAAAFAVAIGVTPPTIHRLMSGTRRASPALAARIALALNRNISDLFQVRISVALNG